MEKANSAPWARFGHLQVALLALLALDLLVGAWLFQEQLGGQRQMVEEQLQAIATLKAEEIAEWRQGMLDQAALIGESPFFAQGVERYLASARLDDAQALLQRLRSITVHYHYPGVLISDESGKVVVSYGEVANLDQSGTLAALVSRAFAERRPVLGDLFAAGGEVFIAVSTPLFENGLTEGRLLGAAVLICDPKRYLFPLVKRWPTQSDSAESLLLRIEGDKLLYLNNLRHAAHPPLTLRLPLHRDTTPEVGTVAKDGGIIVGPDYRGSKVIAYVMPVADSSWFLVSKVDDSEAFAAWRRQSALLIVAFGGIAALLVAFGLVAWHRNRRLHSEQLLSAEQQQRRNAERSAFVLRSINDAIVVTDARGRIELINPTAVALLVRDRRHLVGVPLAEIFTLVDEESGRPLPDPVTAVLAGGDGAHGEGSPTLVLADGGRVPVAIDIAPLHDSQGRVNGAAVVIHDQSRARFLARLTETRIKIGECAASVPLDQLLVKVLDEICHLVDSPIGFYHFVLPDQKTLALQEWSTRTRQEFCHAGGQGRHYDLTLAGVWADCVATRKPVVHNDYAALPHKKGLPPGHAPVVRELVVPVLHQDRVVAIIGVGNKASDYDDRDVEAVSYLAEVIYHIVDAKKTEEALRRSLQTSDDLVRAMPAGLFIFQYREPHHLTLLTGNPEAERLTGRKLADLVGLDFAAIWPTADSLLTARLLEVVRSGRTFETEDLHYAGQHLAAAFRLRLFRLPDSRLGMAFESIGDLKRAEEEKEKIHSQLQQAQKMESVGRLAGGVAHDFNNMLSVIIGNTELALEYAKKESAMQRELLEIKAAALRSAELTRQLLAFARKQAVAPRAIDLNATIEGMLKMLRRLIGEDITLEWLPEAGLPSVFIDPSQVDQTLANLCVNARDAIDGVGRIIIETASATLSEEYCHDTPGATPGDYVVLTVSDTGMGIAREQLGHIFEPFYTTKRAGEGTGLGLAMIYGIVKQNGGYIKVYSEPGQGATFRLYLPQYLGDRGEARGEEMEDIPGGQGQLILLVEDETVILEMNSRILQRLGYQVIASSSPAEAIDLARRHHGQLQLLLTDIIMPEMNGYDLATAIQKEVPELQVLYISGYTANVIARQGIIPEGVNFLQKPFMKRDLALKLHHILNG